MTYAMTDSAEPEAMLSLVVMGLPAGRQVWAFEGSLKDECHNNNVASRGFFEGVY